jgi:ATP-dependent helicase HrpB
VPRPLHCLVRLPVDPFIPAIRAALHAHEAVVVVAAPGAGKTTRIPPALVADGPVILLQPRRVAARTIARRIASDQGWTVGREVGWHVRLDRQFSAETKLLVATEGVLTARLQQDPLLSDFRTVILDEFHERSIHADLGIGLARQAWLARDDLRIVVMSATMDAQRTARYLDDCPVVDVPGRLHPVDVQYRPGVPMPEAVREVLAANGGSVLCFLPGAREVHQAADRIRDAARGIEVVELHGSMSADEQDRALRDDPAQRVIVATNIAETSLTVPGVTAVVDAGLHKVARYDAARGIDSLELERISTDSAEQRAGRAGRLAAGVVRRLWAEADRLRPHREPDIARVDLVGPVLDLLAWGGDPRTFEWFEAPPDGALDRALLLLAALGAVKDGALTREGRTMSRIPVHPRLARILLAAEGSYEAALACAVLSERVLLPQHPPTTTNDLAGLADREAILPSHVLKHARELQRATGAAGRPVGDAALRQAIVAGYPDRVGKRRAPGDPRVLMTGGYGAVVGAESGVRDGEFLVAIDLQAGRRGEHADARIRIAAAVDRQWLTATSRETRHELGADGSVRATEREMYGALVLTERPVALDPSAATVILVDAFLDRPLAHADRVLLNRLRFARIPSDVRDLALRAAAGRTKLDDVQLENGLDWPSRQQIERDAPPWFLAPSGRTHRLEYRDDGSVVLSIKLQELFGVAATPVIGAARVPVLIELLAPNGRAVQTTRDLSSFWNSVYPEVRKELRGRYPRHPWPEDPWTAMPTARTAKRAARS